MKRETSSEESTEAEKKKEKERLMIYQLFPRIFTNTNSNCVPGGTLEQNGSGKLNDFDSNLLRELKDLGINCLWFTGIIEHATKSDFTDFGIPLDNPNVVKGEAGSPYAIKDYYDIDPALAESIENRMAEFESLVHRVHSEGMKLIIDFVPNHTARIYHSDSAPTGIEDFGKGDDRDKTFSASNNYYYFPGERFNPTVNVAAEGNAAYVEIPAKATGNDCFSPVCSENDWYETVKLNYGRDYLNNTEHFDPIPDTWMKMLDILKFWASKGVDGFRCDMVFMVPLPFWHWVIPQVKAEYPDLIFIGEIYDTGLYRPFLDYGKFDYLYDKVNLYDSIVSIERHCASAAQLTGCWQTVDGIGEKMLNFLENHDEVRFSSVDFAGDSLRTVPSLVVSAMFSKGPYMIYYGQELGEPARDNEGFAGYNNRTTIFDYWSVSTLRRWYNSAKYDGSLLTANERWLRNVYKRVLKLCNERDALRDGNFFDLMYANLHTYGFNPGEQFAFLRYKDGDILLIVVNFSRVATGVNVNIPVEAFDIVGLEEGEVECNDLLWGKNHRLSLSKSIPLALHLNADDALVLPLGDSRKVPGGKLPAHGLRGEKKTIR